MGEYATRKSDGAGIKIGTCESMYYMRADQLGLVTDYDFESCLYGIRFRFPFPDEDGTEPGGENFNDFDRAVTVPGFRLDDPDWEHYTVQFKAANGYLMSIPCPEGLKDDEFAFGSTCIVKIHKNGYGGAVGVHSQKFVQDDDGPQRLVTCIKCKGCGALARLHTWEDAEPLWDALRATGAPSMLAIAERVREGYEFAQVNV
jgi:hypothetical protein